MLTLVAVDGATPTVGARSVAVFPLEPLVGISAPAADLISENLVEEVRRRAVFQKVVAPREIALLMPPPQRKQLITCMKDECGLVDTEVAGALGVTHILAGTVGRLGETYLLNLKLLELRTGLTVASLSQQNRGTGEDVLLRAIPPALDKLFGDAGLMGSSRGAPVPRAVWLGAGAAAAVLGGSGAVVGLVTSWMMAAVWTALAYEQHAVRTAVPVPLQDRTARFYAQWLGPGAVS
ncbi:MAG: hypothetical protein AB2A00_43180, partial [Myxococcota bacterium]